MSWCVVNVPGKIQLAHVRKEWATHGNIYCVWEIDMLTPCWVSQSLPPLVDALNRTLSHPKQLQVASMYRVLRGESLRRRHKNYMMQMFSRQEIEELNAHLANFPGCMFVTQYPEEWKLAEDDS